MSSSPSSDKPEHQRDDGQTGEDAVDVKADAAHNRVDGQAGRILEQELTFGQAPRPRRRHRELVDLVRHGGAHRLELQGHGRPRQHDARNDEVFEQVDRLVHTPGRIADTRGSRGRRRWRQSA